MFNDYFGHLALEITNACNLKCKMCSIWREKPLAQLSSKEINDIIEKLNKRYEQLGKKYRPLVTLTGGEPFLHPQFDRIYKTIQSYRKSGYVNSIYIITNGFFTKKIICFLRENNIEGLRMDFSVDGMEKNHNNQRGDLNSFQNLINTIKNIKDEFPSLPVSVKFTINSRNYEDLLKIYEYCSDRDLAIRFLVTVFPWNGYYNRAIGNEEKQKLKINKKQKKKIIEILIRIHRDIKKRKKQNMIIGKESHMFSLLKNLSGNYITRCTSPIKELFINSHGDVYPCIYKKPIINIRDKNWGRKIFGNYHKRLMHEGITRNCSMKKEHCNFLKITHSEFESLLNYI